MYVNHSFGAKVIKVEYPYLDMFKQNRKIVL